MGQNHSNQKIVLDCERMKYPHTGLYHFCAHLGKALLQAAAGTQKEILFYTNEGSIGAFGQDAAYMKQHSYHKFWGLPSGKVNIWHTTFQGSMYWPRNRRIRKVVTVHDLNFLYDDTKSAAKKNKYLRQLQSKINQADAIVAISHFTKNELLKFIDLKGKNVKVIYNGCNVPEVISPQKPSFIQEGETFLFSIGTITAKKNFHVLPCLLADNNYKLVIAGVVQQETYKEKIQEEARVYGVEDRLLLPGAITENEKWWLLQNCIGFVFPSLAEGFGLPVVEAMYFGKPIFISNLSSLPEIGGDCAYYFTSFEAAEMREILAFGMKHFVYNKMSHSVEQRADLFNWQQAAEQYMAIYNSLL